MWLFAGAIELFIPGLSLFLKFKLNPFSACDQSNRLISIVWVVISTTARKNYNLWTPGYVSQTPL